MFSAAFTCFSPYLGYWVRGGGSAKGLVHNLLTQYFTLDIAKTGAFIFFGYCDHLK